jgi:hypothetical protein
MSFKSHAAMFLIEADGLLKTSQRMMDCLDQIQDFPAQDRAIWLDRISTISSAAERAGKIAADGAKASENPKAAYLH